MDDRARIGADHGLAERDSGSSGLEILGGEFYSAPGPLMEVPNTVDVIEKNALNAIEQTPAGYVNFYKAKEMLGDMVDLDNVKNEAVKLHKTLGIPAYLVQAGVIENENQYAAYLERAIIKESDIGAIHETLDSGKVCVPLFFPPLPLEDFGSLIERFVPFDKNPYQPKTVFQRFSGWRVINSEVNADPKSVEDSPVSGERNIKRTWRANYQAATPVNEGIALSGNVPHLIFMPQGNTPAQAPSKLFANGIHANFINPGVYLMHVAQEVIRQAEEKKISPEKIHDAVKLCEITLLKELDKRLVFENYVESDGTVPSLGRHEEELFHDGKSHKEQKLFIVSFPPDRVDPESVYKTTLG